MGRGSSILLERRAFLAAAATGVLALQACATTANVDYPDVVQRLLSAASRNAFARLVEPDGFWNSGVAQVEVPVLFTKGGREIRSLMRNDAFRDQLHHRLNILAEPGAIHAAPVVADAIRALGLNRRNAETVIRGGRTAATTMLRARMGPALVNAMIPGLENALRLANDPVVARALSALKGVGITDAAHALALTVDNAIWYQIGAEETRIRQNPVQTNDPVLIAAFHRS
jgi:hypothetical protein